MKKKTIWISAAAVGAILVAGGATVAIADPFDNDRLSGSALEQASAAALAEVGSGTVSDAETSDDLDHRYSVEVRLSDGGEVDVALDENFDVVWVDRDGSDNDNDNDSRDNQSPRTGNSTDGTGTNGTGTTGTGTDAPATDADDIPLTDDEIARSSEAALAAAGGTDGRVTDIDRSDDAGHAFEVEVTYPDGRDVEVELDAAFTVVQVDDDSQVTAP